MISVHELTKTFVNRQQEILAVDHLTFRVSAGEVYGLLGPNGAGKTTTVRMILGLLTPTSGYAEVEGLRSSEFPDEVKRRVGLVSTSAGLYQWLTSREMLLFFADLYGLDPDRARERLATLSELMNLGPFLDQRGSSTLSTGQKQRVHLARALIHDPPIMLLDEPTRGLDVFGSQAIFDYIHQLRDEGLARNRDDAPPRRGAAVVRPVRPDAPGTLRDGRHARGTPQDERPGDAGRNVHPVRTGPTSAGRKSARPDRRRTSHVTGGDTADGDIRGGDVTDATSQGGVQKEKRPLHPRGYKASQAAFLRNGSAHFAPRTQGAARDAP